MYGHFIKSCKQVYYFCRKSHCKSYVIHVEIMGWERGRGDKKIKKHGEKIREENKLSWITARILRHKIRTLWYLNLTTHRAIYFYQNIEIYSSLTKLEWVECKIFETLPIDVEKTKMAARNFIVCWNVLLGRRSKEHLPRYSIHLQLRTQSIAPEG